MRGSSLRPIDQLTLDWRAVSSGKASREALSLLGAIEPSVARTSAVNLGELVDQLRGAIGKKDGNWAPQVLQAMLRSQEVHPLVPRAILQSVLPGLITVARRLSWGSGGEWIDGGAFFADLITTTWEVIRDWSGEDRPYAVLDILSAVRCRMRRQILSRKSLRDTMPRSDIEVHLVAKASPETSDLELLARRIDDLCGNELERTDAAVLYGHCVLGLSMTELAKMTGRSRRFLADRRRRAEEQICA